MKDENAELKDKLRIKHSAWADEVQRANRAECRAKVLETTLREALIYSASRFDKEEFGICRDTRTAQWTGFCEVLSNKKPD